MAEDSIFRKKSLDRLNSPEELRDYVKVTGTGLWVFLSAVIILLAGVFIWGAFGHMDTVVSTGAEVENGRICCYISESDLSKVTDDTVIKINGQEISIESENISPVEITDELNSYLIYLCDMDEGTWAYVLQGDCTLDDGVYKADVIMDSISPITLIIN